MNIVGSKKVKSSKKSTAHLSVFFLVNLHNSMDDRYIPILDFEYNYFAYSNRRVLVIQEQDITSLKCRLHGTTAKLRYGVQRKKSRKSLRSRIVKKYLKTTTTGDSDFVANISPFHIIKAENTIIARLRAWKVS